MKTGKIDVRLLTGSAIFGIGWGMSGICRKLALSCAIYPQIISLGLILILAGPGLVNFGLSLSTGADLREMVSFASWLGCMAFGGLLV